VETTTEIIAEIGLSHEGSLGIAISSARACIENGADIIKYQAHFPEYESSSDEKFRVQFAVQDETRWDYWKRTSFSLKEWRQLKSAVEEFGGKFSVSIFSRYALDFFLDLHVDVLKLGSGDLTNAELFESLTDYSGILILSSGMATWSEIRSAANWLKSSNCSEESAVLQCTSMYPTPLEYTGINVMGRITHELGVYSGLSDHSQGLSASICAVVAGARYLERHVTLSPYMYGPDIKASISLEELNILRNFRDDIGLVSMDIDKDALALKELREMRDLFGRSLGVNRPLAAGEFIEYSDFCLRKPGGGFNWSDRRRLVRRPLVKPCSIEELLSEEHFETLDDDNA
jgi:N,N'-diacetyllegionaminate synthase